MEKKSSSIDKKIQAQQAKLLEYLRESGNVSFACKRVGISRDTYYRWRQEDPLFAEQSNTAIFSGKEFVNDLAHSQLIRNIQNGDMGAIKFQLANCHEDYHPKRATMPPIRAEDMYQPNFLQLIPLTMKILSEYEAANRDVSQSPPSPPTSSHDWPDEG